MAFGVKRKRLSIEDARVFAFGHIFNEVNALRFVAEVEHHYHLVVVFRAREAIQHIVAAGFDFLESATELTIPQCRVFLMHFEQACVKILELIVIPLNRVLFKERESVRGAVGLLLATFLT